MTDVKTPLLPESVQDAVIANWTVGSGEVVNEGDVIAELETDKVMLEVVAQTTGHLSIIRAEGSTVVSEEVIATIQVATSSVAQDKTKHIQEEDHTEVRQKLDTETVTHAPSVRRALHANQMNPETIQGSGPKGRLIKQDIDASQQAIKTSENHQHKVNRGTEHVPLSRMRQKIAERMMISQQETASLTTFNEVDMSEIMRIRSQYQAQFKEKYEVKLGFMSLTVMAVTHALKRFPDVNASMTSNSICYHHYCDIGVAVSTEKGLVVPVIRDAENMGLADIEKSIIDYANKARSGKISIEDMAGGTFSITNGGIFGSLLSTPMINPPQSAILGMHNIVKRPVVINDEITIRPMMYLALSYDHRIIDGKTAVSFLSTVKALMETPDRLLLNI